MLECPDPPATGGLGDDLPEEYRARIKEELVPGERLIWAEISRPRTPNVSQVPGGADLMSIGFLGLGGVLIAIALGLFGMSVDGARLLMTIGVLLVGVGVLCLLDSMQKWWARKRSPIVQTKFRLYALTERRAIIWSPKHGDPDAVMVCMIQRGKIRGIHRVEYPDGSGDVLFHGSEEDCWSLGGFENVPKVRQVEELVKILANPDSKGTEFS